MPDELQSLSAKLASASKAAVNCAILKIKKGQPEG